MSMPRTRQTAAREPIRETPVGPASAHGRTRVRKGTDRYYIDPSLPPDGWVYQWKRYSVLGQEDPGYLAELAQVGFTPVPADRPNLQGVFYPVGYKATNNCIIVGGQILMERPIELEMEARDEEKNAADSVLRQSREQFGLTTRFDGPDRSAQARAVSGVRTSYERVDAPAPKHEIAID